MENIFEHRAYYPKKFCAVRASSYDNGEIDIVCFNLIMEKSWNLILGNCWEPCCYATWSIKTLIGNILLPNYPDVDAGK